MKDRDLEVFDPERFISRLLGMGDLRSLLEKLEEVSEEDISEESLDAILSGGSPSRTWGCSLR